MHSSKRLELGTSALYRSGLTSKGEELNVVGHDTEWSFMYLHPLQKLFTEWYTIDSGLGTVSFNLLAKRVRCCE